MDLSQEYRVGQWRVLPDRNLLVGPVGEVSISARAMDVLCHLAERSGEVVSRDDFGTAIWGKTVVSDDALTSHISELRHALRDSAASPEYIETIPKRGYRLIAPVEALENDEQVESPPEATARETRMHSGFGNKVWAVLVLIVAAGILFWIAIDQSREALELGAGPASIAVLPFQTLGDRTDPSLADGIHHDLLTRLSSISQLQVTSSTSVQRYRNRDDTIRQIADELGVTWVLEGAVQQFGDQIQVNAQLIDADEDIHQWARTYQKALTAENLFSIQAEIMEDIAESLEALLTPAEAARAERRMAGADVETFRSYSQAQLLLQQRTGSDMKRASELFRELIEHDDSNALAWAGLANSLGSRAGYGYERYDKMVPEAKAAVERALVLDPDLAEAREARARLLFYERNGPAAVSEIRKAIELSPSHDVAHEILGIVLLTLGRAEEGVHHLERAVELGPMAPENWHALCLGYLAVGKPRSALEQVHRAMEIQPGYEAARWGEIVALIHLGQFEEVFDKTEGLARGPAMTVTGLAAAGLGDRPKAEQIAYELESNGRPIMAVLVRAALGEHERALEQLTTALLNDAPQTRGGGTTIQYRYFYPELLGPLREYPGYEQTIRELDRFWGLEPDGRFPD